MRGWRRIDLVGWMVAMLLPCLLLGCGRQDAAEPPAKVHLAGRSWTVELATTRDARYQGVSGRSNFPADHGMLFIYPHPQPLSFCMRDCLIPIDIVFLDESRTVLTTYAMHVERGGARTVYRSGVPAMYALELPGGTIAEAGIRPGQQATFEHVPDPHTAEPGL